MNFTAQDVENMIAAQRSFYFSGATKNIEFRKAQLLKLKATIQKYEKDITAALKLDLNKSEFEAYATEIGIVLDSITHMVKNIDEWAMPIAVKTPVHFQPGKSYIVRDPYGTVLIIGPFNYPFQLVMEPLLGAIIGGNTAIIKPSEATVHTTKIIKQMIAETFEENYIHVVEGEKDEVEALIHASFDFIFFTGSVATGKVIMRAAADRLTPIVLELGGKSPAIVDQTANLQVAAKRIVWGKFTNNGQTCVAPDYVLVHSSVYKKFMKILKQTITAFYGENPQQSDDYGRIVHVRHFDKLNAILEAEAERITFGGTADREDLYIAPTIVEGAGWDSKVMEDEIFGPILPIMAYNDLANAIHAIRRLPKPLAAYLFTENDNAREYFLQELPFGGGCINDIMAHVGNTHLPFGGVGPSGMGAYHGEASFECFTHPKSILQRSTKLATNLLFPPYKQKVKLIRRVMK
ncbi:aldehyde dehydrogenase [Metasolibacillus sp.]|uniref:aldehyde dehydrogenase n=1 Tax=Metasolibacillus sp. TaxID=2703680 RepID=UPI0025F06549|nr:aldehyde dehydrogenase [Metasolibacillus sp.]MCT6925864.1 aldehyde dehydrogenase [Metasolibacillus sp.]MCT6942102.1 aldehyde dehydrogenase [Metasolibacillus sp.]